MVRTISHHKLVKLINRSAQHRQLHTKVRTLFGFEFYKESCLELDARVGGSHVLEKSGRVFADDRLGVVTADVVPLESILVDVVQHAEAGLGGLVDVELGVIGLRLLEVASRTPRLVRPTGGRLVGGRQFHSRARPEPTVDDERLEIFAVASLEIAQAAARPDVGQFLCCETRVIRIAQRSR